jgi:predicted ribosome quality control (RQC) complex YloA/Tae2 family protein
LLQLEPGQEASEESLQYAADVAAYYSQARGSTTVPVGYCSPKYIKRISGAAPGSVSVLRQDGIVFGRPDRGRVLVEEFGPAAIEESLPFQR